MLTADVGRMEALMLGALMVWAVVALGVALVVGRGIRLADARSGQDQALATADLPAGLASGSVSARR